MPKQLRLKNIDSRGGLTVKELKSYLEFYSNDAPVVLRCGKNFRLGKVIFNSNQTPVLVGKRSALK
jgi:hypothetical protein